MGACCSRDDSFIDDPVSAKQEETTPKTQARISGNQNTAAFVEFPATSPPETVESPRDPESPPEPLQPPAESPPESPPMPLESFKTTPEFLAPLEPLESPVELNEELPQTSPYASRSNSKNVSFSPKLAQVAHIVDLNTTIPEAASLSAIQIPQRTITAEETQVYDEDFHEPEYSHTQDKFNKELTVYEITEDMKEGIDQLIEDRIKELQSSQYVMLESAFATLAGIKNGKTKTNQDSYFIFNEFGPKNILQLYGVCDGHGPSGHNVSQYCAQHLPELLVKDQQRILTTLSKPGYALIKAFEELEEKLDTQKKNGELKFDMSASGTTISCGLRVGDYLYLANLGDSRAVMGKYELGKTKIKVRSDQLTVDHDPKNQNEAERIHQSKKGKLMVEPDGTSRIQINLVDDKLAKPRRSVVQLKQVLY